MNNTRNRINKLNYQDQLISKKIANINKILTVLKRCKISRENHKSSDLPFFSRDFDPITFNINSKSLNKYNIPDSLNRNVKLIFELLGDAEREIYIGEWTIMSLNQCIERYNDFCKNGQKDVFDIGYRYRGMGHIEVISCDLKSHLLFYRPDGGSNGYDRYDNYQNIIKNGPDKYEKFFFTKWFYNILK
tara:strand:- start:291 stop:857 length:567 start_codon:yes stop_codon:yes gene_type:complete